MQDPQRIGGTENSCPKGIDSAAATPAGSSHRTAPILVEAVRLFCERHRVRDGNLLVAVSGGADSVALLKLLSMLRSENSLTLFAAHLDHQLRDESARDADWVRSHCAELELPVDVERADLSAAKGTVEEAARRARYEFLQRTAQRRGCRWIATGHTADDQAETVLHQLVRGSGLRGIAGIAEHRANANEAAIVRPLLTVTRAEIESCLSSLDQQYLTDSTNADERFTRNRIRYSLLPLLRREFNPQVDRALWQLAAQAGETQEFLELHAGQWLDRIHSREAGGEVSLRRDPPLPSPIVVREMFVQLWRREDWPRQALDSDHLHELARMYLAGAPRARDLPGGVTARVKKAAMVLTRG